jgi:5-methylcytosine-specific restriction endonuclease McrA
MKCPYVIKVCTKCKRILVANISNFRRSKKGKYGLRGDCRVCEKYFKEYKKNELIDKFNFTEIITSEKVWNHCPFCIKVCITCGNILVANEENFSVRGDDKKMLRNECKICKRKYNDDYYRKNKENISEKGKKYRKENKEMLSERKKKYRKENLIHYKELDKLYYKKNRKKKLEKQKEYYEENKEKITEYIKQYRENNPEKIFNYHNNRRLKEEKQGNGFTKEQWLEMMNFFEWKCAYSGKVLDKKNRTIDHIVSLNKGGENEIWNLVPMLKRLNSSKNAKVMEDWYMEQEFFDIDRLLKIYDWIEYAYNKWNRNE